MGFMLFAEGIVILMGIGTMLWILSEMGVFADLTAWLLKTFICNLWYIVTLVAINSASAYLPDWALKTIVIGFAVFYALGGLVWLFVAMRGVSNKLQRFGRGYTYFVSGSRKDFAIGLFALGVGGYFTVFPELPVGLLRANRLAREARIRAEELAGQRAFDNPKALPRPRSTEARRPR